MAKKEVKTDLWVYGLLKEAGLKYMYAYKFNEGRMKRQYIVVPVKDDDTPDYDYMEQYIKNLIIANNYP